MRLTPTTLSLLVLVGAGAVRLSLAVGDPPPAPPGPSLADAANLEQNLRWILARERAGPTAGAVVGVYADLGAWAAGARSLVEALEKGGTRCRALDASLFRKEGLGGLRALVLPGGWAPHASAGLGAEGIAAVRAFAEQGGRCLGICAGAFLLSREVRWEGATYPYPLALFDGTAEGPLEGLATWPASCPVRVRPTDEGKRRGLATLEGLDVLYYGGPRLVGGSGVEVLATYPDGSAALVARRVGKGEVLLSGIHLERPPSASAATDRSPFPAQAPALLRALLLPAGPR